MAIKPVYGVGVGVDAGFASLQQDIVGNEPTTYQFNIELRGPLTLQTTHDLISGDTSATVGFAPQIDLNEKLRVDFYAGAGYIEGDPGLNFDLSISYAPAGWPGGYVYGHAGLNLTFDLPNPETPVDTTIYRGSQYTGPDMYRPVGLNGYEPSLFDRPSEYNRPPSNADASAGVDYRPNGVAGYNPQVNDSPSEYNGWPSGNTPSASGNGAIGSYKPGNTGDPATDRYEAGLTPNQLRDRIYGGAWVASPASPGSAAAVAGVNDSDGGNSRGFDVTKAGGGSNGPGGALAPATGPWRSAARSWTIWGAALPICRARGGQLFG